MRALCLAVIISSALLPGAGFAEQETASPVGPSRSVPAAGSAPKGGAKTALVGASGMKPVPGTNGAEAPPKLPAAGMPLQSGPISGGAGAHKAPPPAAPPKGAWPGGSPADHNPKSDNTTSESAAEAGVPSSIRPHPLPGYSHGHGVAVSKAVLSKEKSSKPAVGDYTKKNQHPVAKVTDARGQKEKPEKAENHASVPGESLKEQESRLHRMASPQESATEPHSIDQHAPTTSHALAGNFGARGPALIPTASHHSPNPAIIGGGTITSRTAGAAAIGGTSMAGSH